MKKEIEKVVATADSNGMLAPDMLWTPYSNLAMSAGLVENVETEVGCWQRLTAKGMSIKFGGAESDFAARGA